MKKVIKIMSLHGEYYSVEPIIFSSASVHFEDITGIKRIVGIADIIAITLTEKDINNEKIH
jgi:hypothetical protein